MSVQQLLTAEQLAEMPEVAGTRFELVKGVLVEVPGAGALHGFIGGLLYRLLTAAAAERGVGHAFPDGVGYIIARRPDVVRIPDVSFIARGRLPGGEIPEGFIPSAPDLAVEIVSPGDRAEEVYGKVREYLAAGTRLVWVVWPRYRSVTVYTADALVRELREGDELDGGEVLPGFRVRVAELFGPA